MRIHFTTLALALFVLAGAAHAGQKAVTATKAWVAEPAAGETSTSAYAVIDNPTMYDVYIVKVETASAGSARIVESAAPVTELAVPSFGSAALEPGKVHSELQDLKGPLAEGDSVTLTLRTDQGQAITVEAPVRKEGR